MASVRNAPGQARLKPQIRANQSQYHGEADALPFPTRQVSSFDADVISAQGSLLQNEYDDINTTQSKSPDMNKLFC